MFAQLKKFHRLYSCHAIVVLAFTVLMVQQTANANVTASRIHSADHNEEGANWLSHGRGYYEQRYSPLNQVNHDNAAELELAWYFDTGNTLGLQATPLVVDGVMYVTAAWSVVHALDAYSGENLWTYDPQVPRSESYRYCCGMVNRGVAAWGDNIYVGTLDGRLIAIDAASGQQQWSTQTLPEGQAYSITGAPRIVKGKVIIGNGGSEYGVRGFVSAYDALNGDMLWRVYTVPGNPAAGFETPQMEMAAKSWTGEWWKHGGGGTVWDSMAYDPELDLLYIGVGNGAPHNRHIRSPDGGDNLFLCSILALRPDTGEYVWHYQQIPAETWDYTATQHMILADLQWGGETRKVLMQAPKAGFFYIIDRATGELLSAEKYAKHVTWASHYNMETGRPLEIEGQDYADEPALVSPIGLGAHNWHPMSFNPDTGLVYIPAQEAMGTLANDDNFQRQPRHWNTGIDTDVDITNARLTQSFLKSFFGGYLLAWDPATQQTAWEAPHPMIGNGGTLSTAGNLVFQGTVDGRFLAYDAKAGTQLWSYETQNGIVGSPVSYAVNSEQFIAVPAGRGGGLSQIIGLQHETTNVPGRILAFKLGGEASLPPVKDQDIPTPPARMQVSDEGLKLGGSLYSRYCSRCHGTSVVSDGTVPDLRLLDQVWHDNFEAVVLDGMMQNAGMPRFNDVLDKRSAKLVHAYIIDQANQNYELTHGNQLWGKIKGWFYDSFAAGAKWLSQGGGNNNDR